MKLLGTSKYWIILTNIVQLKKGPILPNIVQYCHILFENAQYCLVFGIVQYYLSVNFSSLSSDLWYCKEHLDIFQYCPICPNILRHLQILSINGQILSSCTLFRYFPIKAKPQHLKVWFRCSRKSATCKHASMQVWSYTSIQICKVKVRSGRKVKAWCHFSHSELFIKSKIFYI